MSSYDIVVRDYVNIKNQDVLKMR